MAWLRRGSIARPARWLVALCVFASAAVASAGTRPGSQKDDDTLAAFSATLPAEPGPPGRDLAETLGAIGAACLDNPEPPRMGTPYLWQPAFSLVPRYRTERAFYGCFDWHSDVNTTWAMIRLLKGYPDLGIAPALRATLDRHLGASNLAGELAYFSDPALANTVERPYGFAWLLRLQYELRSWNDPDGRRWAANVQPLARFVSRRLIEYFRTNPDQPVREGKHNNSAFALRNALDYAARYDPALAGTIRTLAKRFYARDINCNTDSELGATDFLSPCLAEAALMGRIMDRAAYAAWLDRFLPPLQSAKFSPLTRTIDPTRAVSRSARSHYLGLGLTRAAALLEIADALPAGDPRVAVLRRLAALHGETALGLLTAVGYDGTHYAAAMVMMYAEPLLARRGSPR